MSKKLHVGNLPSAATKEGLTSRFSIFGIVESAEVVTDTRIVQNRSSGLVEMATVADAKAAIAGLNFTQYGELTMSVSVAQVKRVV